MIKASRMETFGDCRDWQVREIEKFKIRRDELVRRLDSGLPLSKADLRDAKRYKKEMQQ